MARKVAALSAFVLIAACAISCDDKALDGVDSGGTTPAGLTRQQAATVLATVGDKTITLGDFAATLERMNRFDRLRYQTKKRRRQLLQELIDIELLAQEARRRGLEKQPAVREAIRQILRDAILAKSRAGLPPPAAISRAQISKYYDNHKDTFREPERRRVAAIVLTDAAKADEVLQKALAAKTGREWGELFHANSVNAPKERNPHAPADLAGDLGIVGPPGDPKGSSDKVPLAVQKAAFALKTVGDIYNKTVAADGRIYVVRLAGLSKGHTRSMAEADRSIRVAILQQMIRDREKALEKELRAKLDVKVNDQALNAVNLPKALEGYKPFSKPGGGAAPEGVDPTRPPDDQGEPKKDERKKGEPKKDEPKKTDGKADGPR